MSVSIRGGSQLVAKLNNLGKRHKNLNRRVVIVGYTAPYATFVHENVAMKWKGLPRRPSPPKTGVYWGPHGQAKFLEAPTRLYKKEMANIISRGMRAGLTFLQAATKAAYFLLRKSQALVPVDTGELRNSGFVKVSL